MGRRVSMLGIAAILVVLHAPIGTAPMAQEPILVSPDGIAAVAEGSLAVRGRSFVPLHSTVIAAAAAPASTFLGCCRSTTPPTATSW